MCVLELFTEVHSGRERSQIYLDVNVDREPRGRITVELFPDVPVGAQVLPLNSAELLSTLTVVLPRFGTGPCDAFVKRS